MARRRRRVIIGGEEFIVPDVNRRLVVLGAAGLLALIFISTAAYRVGPDEVGVVKRFGKYVRKAGPGLNFKIPFGVETVKKPKIRKRFSEEFGFRTQRAGIQTQTTKRGYGQESLMLTGDLNMGVVNWIVQYEIADPIAYSFNVRRVDKTIRAVSEVAMREVIGDGSVDEVLTFGRDEINAQALDLMQEILDSYKLGIRIISVNLQDTEAPRRVKPAFDEVNAAEQDRDRLIQEAKREYNEAVPRAQGDADKMIKEARAYEVELVNNAEGDASRFLALWSEYRKAKDVTRRRLYLETMMEVLPQIEKKYLIGEKTGGVLPVLPLGPMGGGK